MAEQKTIEQWDPRAGKHVDPRILKGEYAKDYISAESVVIAAGPPVYDQSVKYSTLIPIGVVQNMSVAQSRRLEQLFEIGSRESYFIPGKTFVNASFSRVLIHGPNLLRSMYENYADGESAVTGPNDGNGPSSDLPGGLFWINLAAEVFNRPVGLLLYMTDTENDLYAASYLESCFISSHQLSMSSQQTLIAENVQIRATKVRPVLSAVNIGGDTVS